MIASKSDKRRGERLAAALKANLKRRKAQARARETRAEEPDAPAAPEPPRQGKDRPDR